MTTFALGEEKLDLPKSKVVQCDQNIRESSIWYLFLNGCIQGPFPLLDLLNQLRSNSTENLLFSAINFQNWHPAKNIRKIGSLEKWSSKSQDLEIIRDYFCVKPKESIKNKKTFASLNSKEKSFDKTKIENLEQKLTHSTLNRLQNPKNVEKKQKNRNKNKNRKKPINKKVVPKPSPKALDLLSSLEAKRKYRLSDFKSPYLIGFVYYFLSLGTSLYFFVIESLQNIFWHQNKNSYQLTKNKFLIFSSFIPLLQWYPLWVLGSRIGGLYQSSKKAGFSKAMFYSSLSFPPLCIFYLQRKLNQFWSSYPQSVQGLKPNKKN